MQKNLNWPIIKNLHLFIQSSWYFSNITQIINFWASLVFLIINLYLSTDPSSKLQQLLVILCYFPCAYLTQMTTTLCTVLSYSIVKIVFCTVKLQPLMLFQFCMAKHNTVFPFLFVTVSTSEDPFEVNYLLIGGGTASFAASRAIRVNDLKAKILIVSQENQLPYRR